MGKKASLAIQIISLVAALGALGVGIATLIFVIQEKNAVDSLTDTTTTTTTRVPTTPKTAVQTTRTTIPNTIPAIITRITKSPLFNVPTEPSIQQNDPKFNAYSSFANHLSQWANRTVNPCDDFYQFTCGTPGRELSFKASDEQNVDSMLTLLLSDNYFNGQSLPMSQMKIYFDKCRGNADYTTDELYARSKRIFDDVINNTNAVFPMLHQDQSQTTVLSPSILASLLGYEAGKNGLQTLVQVGVDTDWKAPHDKQGYAIVIDQPATWYRDTIYRKMWSTYEDLTVKQIVGNMNSFASLYNIQLNQTVLTAQARDITQLDFQLATYYSSDEIVRRKYERSYNAMTLDEMQKKWPFVQWTALVGQSMMPVTDTVDVTGSTRVIVMEVDMLSKLNDDVKSGKILPSTLNNYVLFSQVRQLDLPKSASMAHSRPELDLTEEEEKTLDDVAYEPRSSRHIRRSPRRRTRFLSVKDSKADRNCAKDTLNAMQWANTRLFVDAVYPNAYYRQSVRDNVGKVVRSILLGFRSQLDILDWMSSSTKKAAYEKIDNLVVNIAFPDWVLDDKNLSDYYKKLTIASDDKYLTILDKLNDFSLYESFRPYALGIPADRRRFPRGAGVTNAWYQPAANSISFPGGILHAPFYDPSYPAAVNFGSMGVIAGHELTHGFDDEGVQWDGTGVLKTWMDNSSSIAFTSMAKCVVDEYSQFCPLDPPSPCVDGAQTQGENIADNGGMQAAYKAFKAFEALNGPDPNLPGDYSFFSSDQLFFLSFAQVWCANPRTEAELLNQILTDVHSPYSYRVFGTLKNFPGFQKAFNCPSGSAYAPVDHCNVWTSDPTNGNPVDTAGVPVVQNSDVNVLPPEQVGPKDKLVYDAYAAGLKGYQSSSNLSIDPCDDFYQYSCGSYPGDQNIFGDIAARNTLLIRNKLVSADYQATIQSSTALSKLKQLYDACIVEMTNSTVSNSNLVLPYVAKLQNLLKSDIPLLGGVAHNFDSKGLGQALGYLSFNLGIDTLVTPLVDTNWVDPQNRNNTADSRGNQLFVDQLTSNYDRPYYEDKPWGTIKPQYVAHASSVVKAYAKQQGHTVAADFDQQINDLVEFEKLLVISYTGTDEMRRQYSRQWNAKNLSDATKSLDWRAFFDMAPTEGKNWQYPVVFNEFNSTNAMLDMIMDTVKDNKKQAVNYLFLRILFNYESLVPASDRSFMKQMKLRREPTFITGKRPRRFMSARLPVVSEADNVDDISLACADASSALADAQGRVFIEAKYPTDKERNEIRKIITDFMANIVNSVKGMMLQLDWMGTASKSLALKKADNITLNPVYPLFIMDNAELDKEYADLTLTNLSYYQMMDTITQHNINAAYRPLTDAKANRGDFLGQTSRVDAWYQPELNSITLPAGILSDPYFNQYYPSGMNYGGIGVVAGHELTHGFDDEGVQWGYDGTLDSWMDPTSQQGFNSMAQCVINQYDKYCPLPGNYTPNCESGLRTQGENIADNGGIHASFRAYESHVELRGPDPLFADRVFSQFTESQLYFRNFAQLFCASAAQKTPEYIYKELMTNPHSLGMYRTKGPLSNIPAFKAAFNCREGSTYAPKDHCSVWVPVQGA